MSRETRIRDYEKRLESLFATGARGTLARVFGRCMSELSEPDAAFDEIYLAGCFATGTPPRPLRRRDRFRLLVRHFERTLELDGAIAECGCFRGLSSYLLCTTLKRRDPSFDGTGYEIYDSFEGLSEPSAEDRGAADPIVLASATRGKFAFPLEEVRRALAAFPGISYGAGWIPGAFSSAPRSYRFVHVDVDLYQPTRASLEYFWPRLLAGGLMVCDDYNWPGARLAVEQFAAAAGAAFDVTPSNQAVFEKPRAGAG